MGKNSKDKNHIALAGEFAVLSRLLLQGYDASITFGNTKGTDILAFHPESKNKYRVEVKTTTNTFKKSKLFGEIIKWQMHKKHEQVKFDDLFYCFVSVPKSKNEVFRFFIVPSEVVADRLKKANELYIKSGRKGDKTRRAFMLGVNGMCHEVIALAERCENNWEFNRNI